MWQDAAKLRRRGLWILIAGVAALCLPVDLSVYLEIAAGRPLGVESAPFGWAVIVIGASLMLFSLTREKPPEVEPERLLERSGRKDRITRRPD